MNYFKKVSASIVCFLLLQNNSFSQNTKPDSVSLIVNKMAKNNIYEVSYTIGYFGSPSQQYQYFERLLCLASNKQLVDLADLAENAVVRLYSYQALRKKNVKIPDWLKAKFRSDHTFVTTFSGCSGDKKSISSMADTDVFEPVKTNIEKYKL